MKVYVVTHSFKNPRYTTTNGVYRGVFDTVEKAREYIELSVEADTKYFDSTIKFSKGKIVKRFKVGEHDGIDPGERCGDCGAEYGYLHHPYAGVFTREDRTIFIEAVNRFEDQYFNYAIHEVEV